MTLSAVEAPAVFTHRINRSSSLKHCTATSARDCAGSVSTTATRMSASACLEFGGSGSVGEVAACVGGSASGWVSVESSSCWALDANDDIEGGILRREMIVALSVRPARCTSVRSVAIEPLNAGGGPSSQLAIWGTARRTRDGVVAVLGSVSREPSPVAVVSAGQRDELRGRGDRIQGARSCAFHRRRGARQDVTRMRHHEDLGLLALQRHSSSDCTAGREPSDAVNRSRRRHQRGVRYVNILDCAHSSSSACRS